MLSWSFLVDVHPYSVCEKLGPKYASVSVDELNKRQDFYQDLLRYSAMVINLDNLFYWTSWLCFLFSQMDESLSHLWCREDINMAVRLVVNCNGMKINAVKEWVRYLLLDIYLVLEQPRHLWVYCLSQLYCLICLHFGLWRSAELSELWTLLSWFKQLCFLLDVGGFVHNFYCMICFHFGLLRSARLTWFKQLGYWLDIGIEALDLSSIIYF